MNIYRIYFQTIWEEADDIDLQKFLWERGVNEYAVEDIGQGVLFVYTNQNLVSKTYIERIKFENRTIQILNP